MSIEAMKQALEALKLAKSSHGVILTSYPAQDAWVFHGVDKRCFDAITALRQAIAQAELAKPEQSTLESKVKAHIKDLQGCVKVLEDYPRFSDTRLEICKAVEELKQALAKPEQAEKQQALDKKADNARELGLDYEPEEFVRWSKEKEFFDAAHASQQAEKQEPVAWVLKMGNEKILDSHFNDIQELDDGTPLYTAPPRKEWVGLTEDDIVDLYCQVGDETEWAIGGLKDAMPFANLVEAKLKEKNT